MNSLDELLKNSGVVVERGRNAEADRGHVFLHAGQVWAAAEPAVITTILGSCVAICIWDPIARIGGMNHYMLPRDIGADFATPRYAAYSTNLLLQQLKAAGADIARAKARIYGGARIFTQMNGAERDLGMQNVQVARARMKAEKIPVVDEQTGGVHGRKVIYHSDTGDAIVMRVSRGVE